MTEQPRVPGYHVTGVAGVGGSGAVWAAQADDGDRVVIRILRVDTTSERTVLTQRCAAVQQVAHPAVARLRERRDLPGDQVAMISSLIDGPTVATLHTARHGLDAAECLSLARTLLEAVACLHEVGVVHGDVAPANVVLDSDGGGPRAAMTSPSAVRPVLVDLVPVPGRERGTPGFAAPELHGGSAPGAPADVYGVAATAVWAAAPSQRQRVREGLSDLLEDDPTCRPGARAAARALSAQTAPIRPAASEALAAATLRERAARAATRQVPARRPRRRGRHRRRPRVPVVVALVVVVLSAALGGTGWVMAEREAEPRPVATVHPAGSAQTLANRVVALTATRDEALSAADPVLLASVTVPGSAAAEEDATVLESLLATEERVVGLVSRVTDLTVEEVGDGQARVQAVLTQTSHERRTATGGVRSVPAQDPRCTELLLSRFEGQWRVAQVTPCP
ncbi:protein kinase domain-containing protein [Ruania alba]|nr:protein kinase [Ruania alba]